MAVERRQILELKWKDVESGKRVDEQLVHDAVGGFSVPEGWCCTEAIRFGEELGDIVAEGFHGGELVAADLDGDGPLGVGAKGETGGAEVGAFLLQAAGIGEQEAGVAGEVDRIQIAERVEKLNVRAVVETQAKLCHFATGAWVDGEDDLPIFGECGEFADDDFQAFLGIDVGGAMQRDVDETAFFHAEATERVAAVGIVELGNQRVDHDVADLANLGFGSAFTAEVFVAVLGWGEKDIREGVGDETVEFLWHAAVEAAQTSLDVGDGNAELGGDQGAGDGGIHISDDDDPIRFFTQADGFESEHDVGGLHGVGAGANFEMVVGSGNAEFIEENARHLFIVMLAGVDEAALDRAAAAIAGGVVSLDRVDDRRDFHKVRASAGNKDQFQRGGHNGVAGSGAMGAAAGHNVLMIWSSWTRMSDKAWTGRAEDSSFPWRDSKRIF